MKTDRAWMKNGLVVLAAAWLAAGCEWSSSIPEDETATGDTPAADTTAGATAGGASTNGLYPAEITGAVRWLHTDVSSWPVTAGMSASVGSSINFPYSKTEAWPEVDGVNANCWVFANVNGTWYAATFEWLRRGQTSKPKGVLDGSMGDHIKVAPLSGWRPASGERIGLMVSGLARTQLRNVKERSNIVMVTWP